MGIGDWAQSPIPNPQSPIPKKLYILNIINNYYILYDLYITYLNIKN
jgi:hypothetical protein